MTFPKPTAADFVETDPADIIGTVRTMQRLIRERGVMQTAGIAQHLAKKSQTKLQVCQNLWVWCKQNIAYKLDKQWQEQLKLPNRLWADRQGDCDDYSIFCSSVLLNLNIAHALRIADYGNGWQHVYVVVPDGNRLICLDPVGSKFNIEDRYTHKRDFDMKKGTTPVGMERGRGDRRFGEVNKGLGSSLFEPNEQKFVKKLQDNLAEGIKLNRPAVENLAERIYGIESQTIVKELTEYAIVAEARRLARQSGKSVAQRFQDILTLYNTQTNISLRTTQSILLQQYSTPVPITFLLGVWCGIDQWKPSDQYTAYEPTAGNGMMTIAGLPQHFVVNELDNNRYWSLYQQGFAQVTQKDATLPTPKLRNSFDVVMTNPPFGAMPRQNWTEIDGYDIRDLDHLLCIYALNAMKPNGKAALVIGGNTAYDDKGRVQAGKNRIFLNYLYNHYHVADLINIDGSLYAKQGTQFNVRLVLIDGRKDKPEGVAPLYDKQRDSQVKSYEALFERIIGGNNDTQEQDKKRNIAIAKAKLGLVKVKLRLALALN